MNIDQAWTQVWSHEKRIYNINSGVKHDAMGDQFVIYGTLSKAPGNECLSTSLLTLKVG